MQHANMQVTKQAGNDGRLPINSGLLAAPIYQVSKVEGGGREGE